MADEAGNSENILNIATVLAQITDLLIGSYNNQFCFVGDRLYSLITEDIRMRDDVPGTGSA